MKDVGMNRGYGKAWGLKDAYDKAVDKNSYSASFPDVEAVDRFSANYRGGRTAFLTSQRNIRNRTVAHRRLNAKPNPRALIHRQGIIFPPRRDFAGLKRTCLRSLVFSLRHKGGMPYNSLPTNNESLSPISDPQALEVPGGGA